MFPQRPELMRLGGRGYPAQSSGFEVQLEMVRDNRTRSVVPDMPAGYLLRQYRAYDRERYLELFHLAFEKDDPLPDVDSTRLDHGFYVIEHLESGALVASSVAQHIDRPPRHPRGGMLGWLVTDPAHSGRGLGTIVAAAVTNRLADEGYVASFLLTDDFRLAAISVYLKLGWQPLLFIDEMEERWRSVFDGLRRPFRVEECVVPDGD